VNAPAGAVRHGLWQPPLALGFLWGFAEATLFFIIPDVVIGWAALSGWRRGLRMLGAAIAGAVLGGLVLYGFAATHAAAARAAIDAVPFVHGAMLARVTADYERQGPSAILFAPGNGIPYKVYAALAPPVTDPASFTLLTILARLERFLPGWLLFTVVGVRFRRWIAEHPRGAAGTYAAAWAIGYAIYWSLV
jgi:membrane protein YqaA with SNARE-associated domain